MYNTYHSGTAAPLHHASMDPMWEGQTWRSDYSNVQAFKHLHAMCTGPREQGILVCLLLQSRSIGESVCVALVGLEDGRAKPLLYLLQAHRVQEPPDVRR